MAQDVRTRSGESSVTPALLWTLADETTRHVIRYLDETAGEEFQLDSIAAYVAMRRHGPPYNTAESAKIRLYHGILPRMDDHGLLTFEPDEDVVRDDGDRELPTALEEHVLTLDDLER